jgi:hypothetical protein
MEIRGILNKMIFPDEKNRTKVSSRKENSRGDVFEISKEAKDLIQKTKEQQLQQIRERIENNFYSSDEVLNKVAEKILKEIQS